MPDVGRLAQSFEPPPQLGIPDEPTSDAPIMRMTVPVTRGGKIFCRTRGETKDMKISRKAQMSDVPAGKVSSGTRERRGVHTPSTIP